MMHIYVYGSICRGDFSLDSDIDLLALTSTEDGRLNPDKFSIYSYDRLKELWSAGNAFAWHLALESKLIYSDDGSDFIRDLGVPARYTNAKTDCERFFEIFKSSAEEVINGTPSIVFELSNIFLALRNIATCYSLAIMPAPIFARDSARRLGSKSLCISDETYALLMRSRMLSTRGIGEDISTPDLPRVIDELHKCYTWVKMLCHEVKENG